MGSRDKTPCWVSFPEQYLPLISCIIVFPYSLWAFVILLGFSMSLARESFADVWSALARSGVGTAFRKEVRKMEGTQWKARKPEVL